jgi:nanoRNase/pAp phosphatase (c-di-AMP/oligoRNAs hydrolase)
VLEGHQRVLVVTHDHPDPDAIAAGWALTRLTDVMLGLPSRLLARGPVIRAENRQLLALLEPPIEFVDRLVAHAGDAIVLVDCRPEASIHMLSGTDQLPLAVIDHHLEQPRRRARTGDSATGTDGVAFQDVRSGIAATSTIVTGYLCEHAIDPGKPLATALLYAIQSDALGWPVYTAEDHRAVAWLTSRADLNDLVAIRHAPLGRDYYTDLLLALEATVTYGDSAFCLLPRARGPETVGEVADLIIRIEDIDRAACAAVTGGGVYVSVRVAGEQHNAARLARRMLRGIGHAGGHRFRAGGKIEGDDPSEGDASPGAPTIDITDVAALRQELLARWLRVCHTQDETERLLVTRRPIVQNL